MAYCRVATTQDGQRYIVQQIDLRADVVHCWGQVEEYRNGKTKHGPSQKFRRATVTIEDTEKTPELIKTLWRQYIRNLQKAGHVVVVRGRKNLRYVDLGKQDLTAGHCRGFK